MDVPLSRVPRHTVNEPRLFRNGDKKVSGELQQQLFSVDGSVPEGALCAIIGPTDSGERFGSQQD